MSEQTLLTRSAVALAALLLAATGVSHAGSVNLIKDVFGTEIPADSSPEFWGASGGRALFAATSPQSGRELWRSDGTTAGTQLLREFETGTGGGAPSQSLSINGRVLFFVGGFDRELWASDGTDAGTVRLAAIGRDPVPRWLASGSAGYALASIQDTSTGSYDLWRTDGTASGTFRVLTGRQVTANAVAVGNLNYFIVQGSTGRIDSLWVTDGTSAGTRQLEDISNVVIQSVSEMTSFGNSLLFLGSDASDRAVFRYDISTRAITQLLATSFESPETFSSGVASGGFFYFMLGSRLWRTDGTAAGTILLANQARPGLATPSLVAVGSRVLFSRFDGFTGAELWATQGTAATTTLLADLRPGDDSGTTLLLGATGARALLVSASGDFSESRLWVSDGTASGTREAAVAGGASYVFGQPQSAFFETGAGRAVVIGARIIDDGFNVRNESTYWAVDVLSAVAQPIAGLNVRSPGVLAGGRVFAAGIAVGSGVEPWVADPVSGQGTLLLDVARTNVTGDSNPTDFVQVGNLLLFAADDGQSGVELHRSDGTEAGTQLVRNIRPDELSSYPTGLTTVGNVAYFVATEIRGVADSPGRLWRTDGTLAGTFRLLDLRAVVNVNPVKCGEWIVELNGRAYFIGADASTTSLDLWSTDGTSSGTRREFVLPQTIAGSAFCGFTKLGSVLLFAAGGNADFEVWRTDGTLAGTQRVRDINASGSGLDPTQSGFKGFTVIGARAYFLADDGVTGREVWFTDGSSSGTAQLVDLEPGAPSPDFLRLAVAGNTLLIAAIGRSGAIDGLYRSDGTAAGTVRIRQGSLNIGHSPISSGPSAYFVLREASIESLWITDGTAAGTRVVLPGSSSSFALDGAVGREGALFFAGAGTGGSGGQLWMSDGTSSGTRRLSNITGLGIDTTNPIAFFNDRPVFTARGASNGLEPYLVSNAFPVATADAASVVNNTTVLVDVLLNDTDSDGSIRQAGVVVTRQPANGTATLEAGSIRYAPRAGFAGTDAFDYRVIDDFGGTSVSATVTITVTAAPAPPSNSGGGGGGGAMSWLSLLLLAAAMGIRQLQITRGSFRAIFTRQVIAQRIQLHG